MHLTPTEFALLRELALNRGKLLSRAHLLRRVWGRGYETETEYVRVYIRRLRAKLEPPGSPPLILTQPRAGVPDRRRMMGYSYVTMRYRTVSGWCDRQINAGGTVRHERSRKAP